MTFEELRKIKNELAAQGVRPLKYPERLLKRCKRCGRELVGDEKIYCKECKEILITPGTPNLRDGNGRGIYLDEELVL